MLRGSRITSKKTQSYEAIKATEHKPFPNLIVNLKKPCRVDFNVIPVFDATEKIHAHWTFRDITGTIVRKGLSHEQLLTDCINAPLPNHSTIGKVVDDETLLRIY